MRSPRTILGIVLAAGVGFGSWQGLATATTAASAERGASAAAPQATTVDGSHTGTGEGSGEPTAPRTTTPVEARRCFGAASRDSRSACRNRALDRVVTPTPFEAVLEPSEPCIPMRGVGVDACTFGVPRREATGTIALIGDSHALHWRAALARNAERDRLRGVSITRSGCPLTLAVSRGGGRCAGWAPKVLAWLHRHPEVTTVVTSASTGSRFVASPGRTELETAIRGYQAAWSAMPRTVRDVYVIRDVPHMDWQTLGCVGDAADLGLEAGVRCAQSRAASLPPDPAAKAQRRSAIARQHLIDLTAFMCDEAQCYPVVGGALVSKDGGHLTRVFSNTMAPYLQRTMAAARLPGRKPGPMPPAANTPR